MFSRICRLPRKFFLLETQTAAAAAACDELDARIIIHGHLHDCESAIGMEGNGKSLELQQTNPQNLRDARSPLQNFN
jgi:hypothetical protein